MEKDGKTGATATPPGKASIGRPGDWSEQRYEKSGQDQNDSVVRKPGEQVTPDAPASTPVTQKDYEHPDAPQDR